MKRNIFLFLIVIIFFCSCQNKSSEIVPKEQTRKQERGKTEMKITSRAFKEGEMIPSKYTCDGDNVSPQLMWSGYFADTKSFALIADDPDAPAGVWVHWVIYNIPPSINELTENMPKDKTLDSGVKQGVNDSRKTGYDGPCPPNGIHRYYFKLYALDILLNKDAGMTKQELLKVMEGHIIAEAQLMGKYKR
jgi:Raf kinase inhibitor-like YbhB/YbcL family protein